MSYRDKTVDDIIFLFSSQNKHIQRPPDELLDKHFSSWQIAYDPRLDIAVSARVIGAVADAFRGGCA